MLWTRRSEHGFCTALFLLLLLRFRTHLHLRLLPHLGCCLAAATAAASAICMHLCTNSATSGQHMRDLCCIRSAFTITSDGYGWRSEVVLKFCVTLGIFCWL
jgi:hypothetical protein